jgi:hypothetical protein
LPLRLIVRLQIVRNGGQRRRYQTLGNKALKANISITKKLRLPVHERALISL